VRYYGYYSNVSRGKRRQGGLDDAIPCIIEPQGNEKVFRKSWARLIQKIYEVDPLVCPKPVLSLSKDVRGRCGSSVPWFDRLTMHGCRSS
jgi:hypothetical protein